METSIFRPKTVPMSLVGTLVDLEVRYQFFGTEKWENGPKNGPKRGIFGCVQIGVFKARFSALVGWDMPKL